MEQLWANVGREDSQVESPAWHEVVLRARAVAVKFGEEAFMDWDAAKKQLREKQTLFSHWVMRDQLLDAPARAAPAR